MNLNTTRTIYLLEIGPDSKHVIQLNVSVILILILMEKKFVKVQNKFSKIANSTSMNFLQLFCAKSVGVGLQFIFVLLNADSSIQGARYKFVSSIHLPFVHFAHIRTPPPPTKENLSEVWKFKHLPLSLSLSLSLRIRHKFRLNFSFTMINTLTSHNIHHFSTIAVYRVYTKEWCGFKI